MTINCSPNYNKENRAMAKRKTLIQREDTGKWTMYIGLDNGEPLAMIGNYDNYEEPVSRAIDLAFKHQKYGKNTDITINTSTTQEMMTCN